jgi:RNA polymerase sigma-70 factor
MNDETPEARHARARAAHPDVSVSLETFARHWSEREAHGAIDDAYCADVLLAAGIEEGDAAALRWLLETVRRAVAAVSHVPAQHAAEIESTALASVAVGRGDGRPRISRYAAQGPLAAWLQVVVSRTAGAVAQAKGKPLDESRLERAVLDAPPAQAPEVAVLKGKYGGILSEAMKAAAAKLSSRDRSLLAMKYVDGLSTEEIGRAYQVHRATAGRWAESARNALLEALRDELATRMGVSRLEVDSLVRALATRVDVSLRWVLGG